VADFYAARDRTTPPLLWPSIAPPITRLYASGRNLRDQSQNNGKF